MQMVRVIVLAVLIAGRQVIVAVRIRSTREVTNQNRRFASNEVQNRLVSLAHAKELHNISAGNAINNSEEVDMQWLEIPGQAKKFELSHVSNAESLSAHFIMVANCFEAQTWLTYCGVATSVITLNSLFIADPLSQAVMPRKYKVSDFRGFTQDNFLNVSSFWHKHQVTAEGITLDELAAVLNQWGTTLEFSVSQRGPTCGGEPTGEQLDQFLSDVKQVCADVHSRMMINYQRTAIGENGGGHWSPIAAWAPSHVVEGTQKDGKNLTVKTTDGTDMGYVLVLDVAIYKYPWLWFKTEDLFKAVFSCDSSAIPRGYLILTRHDRGILTAAQVTKEPALKNSDSNRCHASPTIAALLSVAVLSIH